MLSAQTCYCTSEVNPMRFQLSRTFRFCWTRVGLIWPVVFELFCWWPIRLGLHRIMQRTLSEIAVAETCHILLCILCHFGRLSLRNLISIVTAATFIPQNSNIFRRAACRCNNVMCSAVILSFEHFGSLFRELYCVDRAQSYWQDFGQAEYSIAHLSFYRFCHFLC